MPRLRMPAHPRRLRARRGVRDGASEAGAVSEVWMGGDQVKGRIISISDAPRGARIIVCGGVDFSDRDLIFIALDELAPSEVAQGAAPGADTLGHEWALSRSVPCRSYPARWRYGKLAGFARNEHMFNDFRPDGILSAPGDRGTRHMEMTGLEGGVWVVRVGDRLK